jgi:hypothetical protein
MRRVVPAALCSLLSLGMLACSPNGGGGDGGTGTTAECDGGTVSLTVNAPSCLWAPNHDMVLFTLADVTATVSGTCSLPTLKVIGVTSNQPDNGGGSGNTTPDYTFNSTGVCLRSERCGTIDTPRVYTITFEATDGNISVTKSVDVVVDHSQDGTSCPLVDSSRIVADGDPRCN